MARKAVKRTSFATGPVSGKGSAGVGVSATVSTRGKPKSKPVVRRATPRRPVRVKAETGDILTNTTPAVRRKLARDAPTRTRTRKVAGHTVTVTADTGDILRGRPVLSPGQRAPHGLGDILSYAASHAHMRQALSDELTGRGLMAKALGSVADAVPDKPEVKVGGRKLKVSTMGPASLIPGVGDRTVRALKDAINFPAQAIPSVYVPVAAAVEAVGGDSSRGRKLLHDLPHTDAGAALLTGHPKRALKLADEHPGFAALEAYGAKGVVGRGAGRALRAAPKRSRLHQVGSTVRPDKAGPTGTTLKRKQSYSRDVTQKAGQVLGERDRARRARRVAATATGDPETMARVKRLDPARMGEAEVRRRVDERVAVNETMRRHNRAVVVDAAHRAANNTQTPTGSIPARLAISARNVRTRASPTAATVLVAQAITKASDADLRAYSREIEAIHDRLPPSQALANRQLRSEIAKHLSKRPAKVARVKVGGRAGGGPGYIEVTSRGGPGRRPGSADLTRAAVRYADVMGSLQKGLADRGIVGKYQTDKAPLVPYAIRRMGAVASEHGPVDAVTGAPVKTAQIRAHMAAHGVKEPAYVTQAPGQRGARNFFVSSGRPPSVMSPTRTGAATARGTFDAHPDVLTEGAAKAQGLIDAADGFAATIREFAHKPTLGRLRTRREADDHANDLYARTGEHWRPVRVQPFGGKAPQLEHLLRDSEADRTVIDALDSAIKGHPGPGPWALMPEAAADQFAAHLHSMGAGPKARALRVVGSNFRRTVLATSPTWMAGNLTEGVGRAAIARAGPLSYMTGRRVLRRVGELDPKAQQELMARATGGGHYSMADRTIHTDSSQFSGGAVLEPVAKGLGAFWRQPGPRHVAAVWHGWTDLVFRQLNGRIESNIQTAMLGRALRESPLMDKGVVKLGSTAIDQAARGLRDTAEQARFAEEVRRMYGRYDAFPPDTRLMIQTYTPFIAWWLNSVKFVYNVLPRDHPALTTLIATSEQATEEWRKQHGLDLFMGGDSGQLPGFLQGSIPLGGGAHQRAPFRYTPFGAFGDPLKNIADAILPQFSGVQAAFNGEDWKGKKLLKPDGSPADELDKAKAAAAAFIDATIPIVAQVKRADAKGVASFNPLAPVKPAVKKARKKQGRVTTVDKQIDAIGADPVQAQIDALLGSP